MTKEGVDSRLLSIGKDTHADTESSTDHIGHYGVEIQAESMRIGNTVLVITKKKNRNTFTVAIMSNEPYEKADGRTPVIKKPRILRSQLPSYRRCEVKTTCGSL